MAYVVAIDGTAGSGKGTVTKLIAEKLNMKNIDTGIIYRTVTVALLDNNIAVDDTSSISKLLENIDINIEYDSNNQKALLNGLDVTKRIRTPEVNALVSQVAGLKIVRDKATTLIRDIADKYLANDISVIMEGRDITTVVFPDALVKIYMDATIEERARRRVAQNKELGIDSSFDEIKESIKKRDYNDMHHEFGALKKADDAIYLDTTNISILEVTDKIIDIIEEKLREEVK